ncbi:hypothetical protein [Moraxella lacunata]|uniref:hypothetical protein n=1 Tax=Moraxella lacunata TaxID=477 RepID=UPI003EE22196
MCQNAIFSIYFDMKNHKNHLLETSGLLVILTPKDLVPFLFYLGKFTAFFDISKSLIDFV